MDKELQDLIQVARYEAEQDRRIDRSRALQLIDTIVALAGKVRSLELQLKIVEASVADAEKKKRPPHEFF